MATSGKKISEQAIADMLNGNEIFPFALNGANGTATTDLLKQYVVDSMSDTLADFLTKPADGTSSQFLKADGSVDGNSYALSSSLGNYLPLTGGTLTGNLKISGNRLDFNINDGVRLIYADNLGYLQLGDSTNRGGLITSISGMALTSLDIICANNALTTNGNTLWHSGNDGAGSGLDADLLDGKHNGELTAIDFKSKYANTTNIVDLNNFEDCIAVNYATPFAFQNSPLDGYGAAFKINGDLKNINIPGMFYWAINHDSSNATNSLWFKARNNLGWDSTWHKIAFTDSNVASADKLTTKQLTNEDLNNIKDANFSSYLGVNGNTCQNTPVGVGSSTGFHLQVFAVYSGSDRVQIYTQYNANQYIRRFNGTQWSPWKKMLTEDDISTLVSRIEALENK